MATTASMKEKTEKNERQINLRGVIFREDMDIFPELTLLNI
jgi:hypothetical protein